MKYLLLSVLVVCMIGVMMAPSVFASDHADTSAYGTVETEKSQYELRKGQNVYVKVFGTIENPGSSTEKVYIELTKPGGNKLSMSITKTSTGYYETIMPVSYENLGQHRVDVTHHNNHIGSITFSVVDKNQAEAGTTPSVITVPDDIIVTTTDSAGAIGWDGTGVSWGDATNNQDCTGNFSPQGFLNGPVSFPIGTTIVTCSASDAAGNVVTASFNVIVNLIAPTVSTITIDSLEVWENYGNTRFEIEGHSPDGPILFLLGSVGSDDEYLITKMGYRGGQDPTRYGLEGGLIPLLTPHILKINQNTNHFIKVCTFDGEINSDNTIGGKLYGGQGGMMTAESKAMLTLCETEYFTWEEFLPRIAVIRIVTSASTPGCEETTAGCFIVNYPLSSGSSGYGDFLAITNFAFKAGPNVATIASEGGIIWENTDNAAHTITSGSPSDGPSGHWDSGLIIADGSFRTGGSEHQPGIYHYYCSLHPWMVGTLNVGGGTNVVTESGPEETPSAEEAAEVIDAEPEFEPEDVDAEPEFEPEATQPVCGPGTVLKNNVCIAEQQTQQSRGGGCLIATAAFGSEMAPQVQFLRELRDNTVLQTQSGTSFMTGFNQFYYSFSPTVADYERENPAFKEAVKITLTPLLTSLTLLQYADIDSESEMLGYGIGVILLNIGMYFVAPAVLIMKIRKRI
jgi:plastocyanin